MLPAKKKQYETEFRGVRPEVLQPGVGSLQQQRKGDQEAGAEPVGDGVGVRAGEAVLRQLHRRAETSGSFGIVISFRFSFYQVAAGFVHQKKIVGCRFFFW